MLRKLIHFLLFIAVLSPIFVQGQIGGRHVFDFIKLTPQARVAALGGENITTIDHDQTFGYLNPATVNDSMHQRLSLSWVNYLAGIDYGYASYAHSFEGIGDFHAGIQYVGYGELIQADQFGNKTGTFGANDLALIVGGARQVYNFRIGVNLKFLNSNIAGYNSFTAMAMDLGGTYLSDDKLFSAGLVIKNIGFQMGKFTPTSERESIPFEMQVGISYRLEHMPLRFSITGVNLQNPRLIYKDPDPIPQFDLSGNEIEPKKNTADDIFGHFVFGTEFLISKGFNLRAGYNHLRRVELKSENRSGASGFSFGFGIKISHFIFDYGFANYHAVGGTHALSLSTSIGSFKKK